MKAGWTTKSLGELCDVIGGGTPPKDRPDYYGGDIPWATVRDMRTDIITSTEHSITAEAVKASATNIIPAGNVVIATRVGLGKVCLLAKDTAVNQDLRGIVPKSNKEINVAFLFAWFKSISEQIIAEGTGATVQGVKLPFIKGLAVPFPEMDEQRRIVTLLDEAFADIATAKANAEKNLQNANELLKKVIEENFQEAIDEYGTSSLGSICMFENGDRGKNYPGKQHRVAHGVPFINAGHLTTDGIDFSEMDYISPDRFALLGNGKIQTNDVLFCLRGSLGKFSCVEDLAEGAIASSLVILRPQECLVLEYLLAYLSSSQCANQIDTFKGGAAQPNLGAKDLKQFAIPLPPKNIQIEIASRLSVFKEHVDRLVSTYKEKLTALDDLKKSLLHQAFSGFL